jgi:hypothetical protein
MINPKEVGEQTEAAILNHFIQRSIPVSIPWGNNQRYDLIIDVDGVLLKAQCKTGSYKNGIIRFQTASRAGGKTRKNYIGQIDCFLVFCKELNTFYKINVGAAPKGSTMSLRVDPLKKFGPKTTINWAKDYQI